MRDVARPLRRGPPRPRPGRRGRDGAARLGRLRHLLPLSAGALAAPADEQPAGVGLQRGAVADQCGQADAPPRRRALPGLQAGRAAEPELAGAEWGANLMTLVLEGCVFKDGLLQARLNPERTATAA